MKPLLFINHKKIVIMNVETLQATSLNTLEKSEEAFLKRIRAYRTIQKMMCWKLYKNILSHITFSHDFSNEDLSEKQISVQIELLDKIDDYVGSVLPNTPNKRDFIQLVDEEPRAIIKALVNGNYLIPLVGVVSIEEYSKY